MHPEEFIKTTRPRFEGECWDGHPESSTSSLIIVQYVCNTGVQ
jgi:hypothetical protein